VALAHFELHAWCLLVLGWVMVPFYMRSGVYTMPEFLERRFSPAARWVLSLISLVAYVLTKMAVGIFAGGVVSASCCRVHLPIFVARAVDGWAVVQQLLESGRLAVGRAHRLSIRSWARHARRGLYAEAVQTAVLVVGSLLLTVFASRRSRLERLRARRSIRRCSTWWKPIRAGSVESTWAPATSRGAWRGYFNQGPTRGQDAGSVRRSSASGTGARDQYIVSARSVRRGYARRAQGTDLRAPTSSCCRLFIFIVPGMIARGAWPGSGRMPLLAPLVGADGTPVAADAGGLSR
jgi:SSS family solute:Na+ symporter